MKPKQIIFLTALLGILALAVTLRNLQKPAELATEEYVSLDLSFDQAKAAKIDVTKPKDEKDEEYVDLVKTDSGWKVASLYNARADEVRITELLDEIKNAKGEVRSRDKMLFPDFKIGDDQAIRYKVTTATGEVLVNLLVGRKKAGQELFIRSATKKADPSSGGKDATDIVFLTSADFLGKIGMYGDPEKESLNNDYWPALNLVDFEAEKVQKIEAHRFANGKDTTAYNLERQPSAADASRKEWKSLIEGLPFNVDTEKVDSYLNSFKTWHAQKVLDPNAKDKNYGFDKPEWRIKATLEGDKVVEITAGGVEEESKSYFMQVTGEPVVFQLIHFYAENMNGDASRFFAENPLEMDPEKVEKLVIHADKVEHKFKPKEKKWDALTAYLADFKNEFRVSKILYDPVDQKKVRANGKYWIEIQKEGEVSKFLDVGELVSPDSKEVAAAIRASLIPFSVEESFFKKFFENLDRLKEPTPPASS